MQARQATTEETQDALSVLTNRIQAFANAHNFLHRAEDVTQVDLQQHLESLTDRLASAMGDHQLTITCKVDAVPVAFDTATELALIVNELVTNVTKHAMQAGQTKGCVTIEAHQSDGTLHLRIADDGEGLRVGHGRRGMGTAFYATAADSAPASGSFLGRPTTRLRPRGVTQAGDPLPVAPRAALSVATDMMPPPRQDVAVAATRFPRRSPEGDGRPPLAIRKRHQEVLGTGHDVRVGHFLTAGKATGHRSESRETPVCRTSLPATCHSIKAPFFRLC